MLRSGDEVREWRRVPRAWHDHVEEVRAARREVDDLIGGVYGVSGAKVVRSDRQYGGRDGIAIAIELDESAVAEDLPEAVQDVPVETERIAERGLNACFNTGDFGSIPGGAMIGPADQPLFGTACSTVAVDGERRLLTAAHLWHDCEATSIAGAGAEQSGRFLGRIDRANAAADVAFVAVENDDVSLADGLALADDRQAPVGGVVADWGVSVLLTGDEQVYNVGASSGLTAGSLTARDVADAWAGCITFDGHGVEAGHRNAEGDSGGPLFYRRDGECYLVGLQQMWLDEVGTACGSNTLGDRGRGTAAYHVADAFDARFDVRGA